MRSKAADITTIQKEKSDKGGTLTKWKITPATPNISAIHQVIFFGADVFNERERLIWGPLS